MYCYQCGKQVEEDVKFCPYCGAQLNSHDQNNGNGYNPINQNYQGSYQKPDDESSFGYALLSFFYSSCWACLISGMEQRISIAC